MPTLKPLYYIIAAMALLASCRCVRPVDTIPAVPVQFAVDSLGRPVIAHMPVQKPTFIQKLFGTTPKAKFKNVTISVNNQTASGGSTIGANDQSGTDNSKVKRSAESTAETSNTGGQGSKVDGDAKATASNKQGGNSLWWYVVAAGAGFALRQFGPMLWRMVKPV